MNEKLYITDEMQFSLCKNSQELALKKQQLNFQNFALSIIKEEYINGIATSNITIDEKTTEIPPHKEKIIISETLHKIPDLDNIMQIQQIELPVNISINNLGKIPPNLNCIIFQTDNYIYGNNIQDFIKNQDIDIS